MNRIEVDAATADIALPPLSRVAAARLDVPAEVQPIQIAWWYVSIILAVHLLSLLMLLPWYFSWTGVLLLIGGACFYGILGNTVGYHRLLTHQGFTCPKWLEHTFAIIGVCTLQDTPARYVAIHRLHHQHSDKQPDPHTPLVNFLWSHVGWLLVRHREHSSVLFFEQYARDLLRDPFYLRLERKYAVLWVYFLHAVAYFAVGFLWGWLASGMAAGVQLGASFLVWGVFARTLVNWHVSWAVNSVTHLWGYRNYDTADSSRNHWLVALVTYGEGWHNNHHADQRSAVHGHKWWEFDPTYQFICLLEFVGLAKNVIRPRAWREKSQGSTESIA